MNDLNTENQKVAIEKSYQIAKVMALVFLVILPALALFVTFVLMVSNIGYKVYGTSFLSSLLVYLLLVIAYVYLKRHLIVKYGMYSNILTIREEKTKKEKK